MPKLRQYADKYAAEGFRKEMRIRQGEQDLMSKSALAEAADLPRTTVTKPPGMRRCARPQSRSSCAGSRKHSRRQSSKPSATKRKKGWRHMATSPHPTIVGNT